MAQVIVTESSLENIASAIRGKLNTQDTYKPSEMAGAISQIHGDPVLETLTANANSTYTPSSGKDGFSQVVVNVPNSYTSGDEGKVVSGGALVAQSAQSITQNGTYDTTLKNQAIVNVPNSYSASDEGKVVDNGALVAQGSQTITQNGTYDTTLINQLIANISGGGGGGGIQTGTTPPTSDMGSDGDYYKQIFPLSSGVNFVEYLQSSGTQYIDTNIIPTQAHDLYAKVDWMANTYVVGVRGGSWQSSTNSLYIGATGANELAIVKAGSAGVNGDYRKVIVTGTTECQTVSKVMGDTIIANSLINNAYMGSNAVSNFMASGSFVLFALRTAQSTINKASVARIYRLVLFENCVPIADYLPCLDGNGVACMWDNVAQEYVYNDGTGDFTYGSTYSPIELDPILYVKENGAWRVVGQ